LPPVDALAFPGFADGFLQLGNVERLEQVVEGAETESLEGRLVVSRHEDEAEVHFLKSFQQAEAYRPAWLGTGLCF
jgi:hypothetical protein